MPNQSVPRDLHLEIKHAVNVSRLWLEAVAAALEASNVAAGRTAITELVVEGNKALQEFDALHDRLLSMDEAVHKGHGE